MTRRVSPCPCGCPTCRDWHVSPEAELQGVRFTERQARAVAALLDAMDSERTSLPTEPGWYYARETGFERIVPVEVTLFAGELRVSQGRLFRTLRFFDFFGPVPMPESRP